MLMFNINSFDSAGKNFGNIKISMIYWKICPSQPKILKTFRKVQKILLIALFLKL